MDRVRPVPQSIVVPHQFNICKKHKDAMCVFDGRSFTQCPFCAAQDIINPRLKDESPCKGARPIERGSMGPIGGDE
jgi:hypothetical protein